METVLESTGLILLDNEKKREDFVPVEIKMDFRIIRQFFRISEETVVMEEWTNGTFMLCPYSKVKLDPYSREYKDVLEEFKEDRILKIEKVQNTFLYFQYKLKLKQKQDSHGRYAIKEHTLYHGTKTDNIDSICKNNFNWRRLGDNGFRSSKFGQGVSFSPSPTYASDYPRRCYENPRIMIVAKVMELSRCEGDDSMVIPPLPHDTSADLRNDNVVVKYFDNEFYPQYIIYYKPN